MQVEPSYFCNELLDRGTFVCDTGERAANAYGEKVEMVVGKPKKGKPIVGVSLCNVVSRFDLNNTMKGGKITVCRKGYVKLEVKAKVKVNQMLYVGSRGNLVVKPTTVCKRPVCRVYTEKDSSGFCVVELL